MKKIIYAIVLFAGASFVACKDTDFDESALKPTTVYEIKINTNDPSGSEVIESEETPDHYTIYPETNTLFVYGTATSIDGMYDLVEAPKITEKEYEKAIPTPGSDPSVVETFTHYQIECKYIYEGNEYTIKSEYPVLDNEATGLEEGQAQIKSLTGYFEVRQTKLNGVPSEGSETVVYLYPTSSNILVYPDTRYLSM